MLGFGVAKICSISGSRMADDYEGIQIGDLPPMAELPEIKLFGRWSCDDVQVSDMSLQVSFLLLI